jgi:hypothetical protein
LGAGKGNGERKGGGGQFTSNLGPEWTGIAPHTKEGFQVSERDLGSREGRQAKGKLTRGIIKGTRQGVCAMCSDIVNLYISIMLLCVCG